MSFNALPLASNIWWGIILILLMGLLLVGSIHRGRKRQRRAAQARKLETLRRWGA